MKGSYPRTKAIMEERRKRAEEVQARSAGLSPEERLAKLDDMGVIAARERLRLQRTIRLAEEAAELLQLQKKNKKK